MSLDMKVQQRKESIEMRNRIRSFEGEARILTTEEIKQKELNSAKKMAMQACRDFMLYKVKGYDAQLLDALEKATSEAEIRALLRKARSIA